MSTAVKNQPIDNSLSKIVADGVVNTSLTAATGALGAYLFTSIHPIGGAIFGVTYGITSSITAAVLNKLFGNSTSEKVLKFALDILGSIALAVAITSLVGYTITFGSAIYLIIAMAPAAIITAVGFSCLTCCAGA